MGFCIVMLNTQLRLVVHRIIVITEPCVSGHVLAMLNVGEFFCRQYVFRILKLLVGLVCYK